MEMMVKLSKENNTQLKLNSWNIPITAWCFTPLQAGGGVRKRLARGGNVGGQGTGTCRGTLQCKLNKRINNNSNNNNNHQTCTLTVADQRATIAASFDAVRWSDIRDIPPRLSQPAGGSTERRYTQICHREAQVAAICREIQQNGRLFLRNTNASWCQPGILPW